MTLGNPQEHSGKSSDLNQLCLSAWNSDLILISVIQSWSWIFCQSEIAGMALSHEDSSCSEQELRSLSW